MNKIVSIIVPVQWKWTSIFYLLFFMNDSKAQDHSGLTGKTFSAQVQASCKAMSDGTCMLYTYCILDFKKDSVSVYYVQRASRTNKSREAGYAYTNKDEAASYTWSLDKNNLIIHGFEDFAPFTFEAHRLKGFKRMKEAFELLEFTPGIPQTTSQP